MLSSVVAFWEMRERLGLPDLFDALPVQTADPAGIETLELLGFGPNTFAFENWDIYYEDTRGILPGLDYLAPPGSPLVAVADGVIVDVEFLPDPAERTLALRPYLPPRFRHPDGSRVLSNVIVGYGHLTGDPTVEIVQAGDEVRAGQIIGASGWPVFTNEDGSVGVQRNNARLRLEVHLVTDGAQEFGSQQPFNPLLFWSPRLIAFQARLAAHSPYPPYPAGGQPWGRLGFFTLGCFRYTPPGPVWSYEPTREALWPEGVYDVKGMLDLVSGFKPYLAGGIGPMR